MPRWTEESRARQSALTRRQKPWQNSTGPRTEEGKEKSKHNSCKHGFRSIEWKEIYCLLRFQRQIVQEIIKKKWQ